MKNHSQSIPQSTRRTFLSQSARAIALVGLAGQAAKTNSQGSDKNFGEFSTGFRQTRDLAVGADERIYIAGDKGVVTFDFKGNRLAELQVNQPPRSVVEQSDGRLVVALKDQIVWFSSEGEQQKTSLRLGRETALTKLAISETGSIFAADGGTRSIWILDREGEVKGRIEAGQGQGFAVPKAFFPITWANGQLIVGHPGRHRIEHYTGSGELVSKWGNRSRDLKGFAGCCNPVGVAVTPKGEFVTVERGQPRLKLFDREGQFKTLIAGPERFDLKKHDHTSDDLFSCQHGGIDVAVTAKGRIVTLEHDTARVRIFETA